VEKLAEIRVHYILQIFSTIGCGEERLTKIDMTSLILQIQADPLLLAALARVDLALQPSSVPSVWNHVLSSAAVALTALTIDGLYQLVLPCFPDAFLNFEVGTAAVPITLGCIVYGDLRSVAESPGSPPNEFLETLTRLVEEGDPMVSSSPAAVAVVEPVDESRAVKRKSDEMTGPNGEMLWSMMSHRLHFSQGSLNAQVAEPFISMEITFYTKTQSFRQSFPFFLQSCPFVLRAGPLGALCFGVSVPGTENYFFHGPMP